MIGKIVKNSYYKSAVTKLYMKKEFSQKILDSFDIFILIQMINYYTKKVNY